MEAKEVAIISGIAVLAAAFTIAVADQVIRIIESVDKGTE